MVIKTEVTLAPVEDNAPSQAVESPQLDETQEQVKTTIEKNIVLEPIIQPIVYQDAATIPIQWQSYTLDPRFEEKITYAEEWNAKEIAQPLIAKGVTVYNDTIPINTIRPREYAVFTVDDTIQDISFSDNNNQREESFCTWIIQGQSTTFNNYVVEISRFIHDILRMHRNKGKVRSITDRSIGFDEQNNLLSRTITFWLQYK